MCLLDRYIYIYNGIEMIYHGIYFMGFINKPTTGGLTLNDVGYDKQITIWLFNIAMENHHFS